MSMTFKVTGQDVFASTGGRTHEPGLPSAVFVHGAGMDHTVWVLQSRYFAHHGRNVLAVDLPGHGRSGGAPLESIEAIADWLLEVIEVVGLTEVCLIGHSLGAVSVLEAAVRAGEKLRCFALLGAAQTMPVHPDMLAAAKVNDHLAIDMINGWGHGAQAHRGGYPLPGTWLLGAGNRLLERAADGVIHTDLKACNDWTGGEAAARKVTAPSLVIMGAGDMMTPARAGRKLCDALPQSKGVFLTDCGHMMMLERPDAVLDALKQII